MASDPAPGPSSTSTRPKWYSQWKSYLPFRAEIEGIFTDAARKLKEPSEHTPKSYYDYHQLTRRWLTGETKSWPLPIRPPPKDGALQRYMLGANAVGFIPAFAQIQTQFMHRASIEGWCDRVVVEELLESDWPEGVRIWNERILGHGRNVVQVCDFQKEESSPKAVYRLADCIIRSRQYYEALDREPYPEPLLEDLLKNYTYVFVAGVKDSGNDDEFWEVFMAAMDRVRERRLTLLGIQPAPSSRQRKNSRFSTATDEEMFDPEYEPPKRRQTHPEPLADWQKIKTQDRERRYIGKP
ncbi:hypothetical protein NA57DRAFT_81186 [Rhizodiscina lignyota]|uniref:Uncharacterized protein n=1 Tax=Rhizodiscina lignyota TaxID=1504668 RepID=A0A9P4I675_9PEZI|nr:hypothetical protein NA57DRAFT_81186 [Rhizodiscina lignyota]